MGRERTSDRGRPEQRYVIIDDLGLEEGVKSKSRELGAEP